MKQVLTITALLFILNGFGQNWKLWKSTDDIKSKDLPKMPMVDIKGVLTVSSNNDTLEIQSKDIKFIKVDGKVYEIKRTTELKEVDKVIFPRGIGWGIPTNLIDTAFFNYKQKAEKAAKEADKHFKLNK